MSTVVNKTPRLPAAAKEFNVGMNTIVEALTAKGFAVTNSPAFKLTEEMYSALEVVYASDRATKQRSDAMALPKTEARKREEAPVITRKPPVAKPAEPAPKAEPVAEAPKEEVAPVIEAVAPQKEEPVLQPVIEVPLAKSEEEQPVTEEEKPKKSARKKEAEQPAQEAGEDEALHIKTKAPKLGGPTIIGKIDLDGAKKSAAKPAAPKEEAPAKEKPAAKKKKVTEGEEQPVAEVKKKPAKTTAAKPEETAKPVAQEQPKVEIPVVTTPQQPEVKEEEKREHIEMKAPQLTGPKIIGRIELPVNDPSKSGGAAGRRERKRIPVTKRPENFRTGAGGNNGQQQQGGGQQGQGGGGGFNRGGGGQQGGGGFNRGRTGGGVGTGTGGNRTGTGGGTGTGQPGEVDKKEIQRKIQETQARLSGGGRGNKAQKGKYRRDKRELMAEKRAQLENKGDGNILPVTEFISVSELANLMDVSFADVISKCMGLGIMVSINQRLDAEVIELVAAEFGYEVQFINLEQEGDAEVEEVEDDPDAMEPRAPIVTIMGHVDHGKTSLLDYIRQANVVAGEAGGITQHIGAYQVSTESGKKITFLDTPGHEAFTAMRARGAKVADVAVIVIAADDAIMPQTREAISHAQAAQLPMVFAINKIDKDGADPERIRQQLSAMNILVEEWGGNYQSQEISAKKGLNVDLLLEKIGLQAELLDLKAASDRNASGSVIEASLDKGRGYVATILVQNGTLNQGDMIVTGQHYGRIRAMLNERGQRVEQAGPSSAVQVLGLNGAPQAGEKFKMYEDEDDAKEVASHRAQILREQGIRARKHLTIEEIGRRIALGNFKELPVIIKGDFDGSVEALSDSLQKLSTPEVAVNVVHKGVGQITESDILLATASDAIIIGFQVRPSSQAGKLAEQEDIQVKFYSIIYDAINDIKTAMEGLLVPTKETKITANVEVREVFKISGVGTIAGCYVLDGKIARASRINIIRDGKVVQTGELASLKRFKDDQKEVAAGYECGLSIKNYADIRVGDIIEGFEEVEVKRTLASSATA